MLHPQRPADDGRDVIIRVAGADDGRDAIIRVAGADDAESMGAFLVPTWLEAHRGQVPREVWQRRRREWTPEVSAAAWRRTLAEIDTTAGHPSTVLVAEVGRGELVGLGMVTIVGAGSADVDALYVGARWRGRGLGRSLLAELARVAVADGATTIATEVLAANTSARRFYEHLGGRVVDDAVVDDDGIELPAVRVRWSAVALAGACS